MKKILITIAIVLLLIALGLFIWALMISRQSGGEVTVTESLKDIVSFGSGETGNIFTCPENGRHHHELYLK